MRVQLTLEVSCGICRIYNKNSSKLGLYFTKYEKNDYISLLLVINKYSP